ncbi:hypothetical protein WJX72_007394 [[Myrmecia] bisecta]|uniref:Uncharacterized protein n=1 Tax=[Myrmecia] bisecta TaxID=41462 RepID=A0AAW1PQS4_9CHLO
MFELAYPLITVRSMNELPYNIFSGGRITEHILRYLLNAWEAGEQDSGGPEEDEDLQRGQTEDARSNGDLPGSSRGAYYNPEDTCSHHPGSLHQSCYVADKRAVLRGMRFLRHCEEQSNAKMDQDWRIGPGGPWQVGCYMAPHAMLNLRAGRLGTILMTGTTISSWAGAQMDIVGYVEVMDGGRLKPNTVEELHAAQLRRWAEQHPPGEPFPEEQLVPKSCIEAQLQQAMALLRLAGGLRGPNRLVPPGRHAVGTYWVSDKASTFGTLPPDSTSISAGTFEYLEAVLRICLGERVCLWSLEEVKARLAAYRAGVKQRVSKALAGAFEEQLRKTSSRANPAISGPPSPMNHMEERLITGFNIHTELLKDSTGTHGGRQRLLAAPAAGYVQRHPGTSLPVDKVPSLEVLSLKHSPFYSVDLEPPPSQFAVLGNLKELPRLKSFAYSAASLRDVPETLRLPERDDLALECTGSGLRAIHCPP